MTVTRSLHVGINTYPNAPLAGCVNDARAWEAACRSRGYWTTTLLDAQATKDNILEALEHLVTHSRWSDRIVFTYSGHGSWIPDLSGDEEDARDEVLCPIDYETGRVISDDELAEIFGRRRRGVRVTIFSDSCHSGSVSRVAGLPLIVSRKPLTTTQAQELKDSFQDSLRTGSPVILPESGAAFVKGRVRFVDPSTFLTRPSQVEAIARLRRLEAKTTPRTSAGTVLFSGCTDEEYSWDAWIDGRPQGAFTAAAIRTLEEKGSWPLRYGAWHKAIRGILPSETYPQTPQLYASLWQRTWTL